MNSFEKIIFDFFSFIRKYFKSLWSSVRPSLLIWRVQNEKTEEYIHPVVYLSISIFIINYLYVPIFIDSGISEITDKDWSGRIQYLFSDFVDYSLKEILPNVLVEVPLVFLASRLLIFLLGTPKINRRPLVTIACYQYCLPVLIYSFLSLVIPPNTFGYIVGFLAFVGPDKGLARLLIIILVIIIFVPILLGLVFPVINITRKYFKRDFKIWLRLLLIILIASTSMIVHPKIVQFNNTTLGMEKRDLNGIHSYKDLPDAYSSALDGFSTIKCNMTDDTSLTFNLELVLRNNTKCTYAVAKEDADTLLFDVMPLDTFFKSYKSQVLLKKFLAEIPAVPLYIDDWEGDKKTSYNTIKPGQFLWVKLKGSVHSKTMLLYYDSLFKQQNFDLRADNVHLQFHKIDTKHNSFDDPIIINEQLLSSFETN